MNLEAARQKAGLTREQAAVSLGIAAKTLYNWEIKNGFPSGFLPNIKRVYNLTDAEVLSLLQREAS